MLPVNMLFPVLLFPISGVSAGSVLPPTNLSVSCANVQVIVSWEYGNQQTQTSFNVTVKGVVGKSVWRTTDQHHDLTPFIWTAEEYYMDNFYVTVTAIQGGDQSEPVTSKTFTFNNVKTTDIICKLDVPPAALDAKESGATVHFRNPFHYYEELRRTWKPDTASMRFTVSTDDVAEDFDCSVKEENCKHDMTFLPECITLSGMLSDEIGVGQVLFRETDRICTRETTNARVLVLAILLPIVVALIVVIAVIFKVKSYLMETPKSPPKSLLHSHREQGPSRDPVCDTKISAAQLVVSSRKHPSVGSATEGTPTDGLWDSSSTGSYAGQLAELSDEPLEAVGLMAEGRRTVEDDSVKPACDNMNLEKEEAERSPYDRPHILHVDMGGDGEMAIAYGRR
ncbi:interferon gamma receptor 1 [Brachionichthys hirsutus]|uniref:interferon gamma receptor 1 n=1 Tax=Brachionichthys hirsutus TaxID=412623 RepID=UPI0036051355